MALALHAARSLASASNAVALVLEGVIGRRHADAHDGDVVIFRDGNCQQETLLRPLAFVPSIVHHDNVTPPPPS